MVRVRDVAWALVAATAVTAGARTASAAAITQSGNITLTGNVANDFTAANGSTQVPIALQNSAGQLAVTSAGQPIYTSGPGYVAGPDGSNPNVLVSGADMKSVSFNYNATTDTMYVGIQGFTNVAGKPEIIGDLSGNPNPALDTNSNPQLGPIASATNTFLGSKSIALAFAPITQTAAGQSTMGTPSIIAGIPAVKPVTTSPNFMVAQYSANGSGLPFSFGQQIANGGKLAFNTTASTPDFEFTINNFSKVSGINPANGFYIQGYNGMAGAGAGKSEFLWMQAPPVPQGLNTPEPTTWLAWVMLAGGAGWRYRRRRLLARA